MNNKRYIKQIKLDGFGLEAQEKLINARVLIIGAGGLGCPAITYLAASGTGTIGIMDHDVVDETNLHRQPLYSPEEIGKPKVQVAAARVQKLNPDARCIVIQEKIIPENAIEIINEFDLVLDCTDNYEARYLINDACILLDKPWIYGAVEAWQGQLAVFNFLLPDGRKTASYRCLFPEASENALNCNDIGVIGTMPGTIGIMQANEAIKMLGGIGEVQQGLLLVDLLQNNFQKITIPRNDTAISEIKALKKSYAADCNTQTILEIEMEELLQNRQQYFIIDIREQNELTALPFAEADLHIPMPQLMEEGYAFEMQTSYVLVCASGKRSLTSAEKLMPLYPGISIISLKNGVNGNTIIVK